MKQLKCRDAGFDCDAVVEAESVAEVMGQAAEHVRTVHGQEVTPEMAGAISGQVRDV